MIKTNKNTKADTWQYLNYLKNKQLNIIDIISTHISYETMKAILGIDYLIKADGDISVNCDYTNIPTTLKQDKTYWITEGIYLQDANDIVIQSNAKLIGVGNKYNIIIDWQTNANGFVTSITPNLLSNTNTGTTRNSQAITNIGGAWASWTGIVDDTAFFILFMTDNSTDHYGVKYKVTQINNNNLLQVDEFLDLATGTKAGYGILLNMNYGIEIRNLTIQNSNDILSALNISYTADSIFSDLIFYKCKGNGAMWADAYCMDCRFENIIINDCEGVTFGAIGVGLVLNCIFKDGVIKNCRATSGSSYGVFILERPFKSIIDGWEVSGNYSAGNGGGIGTIAPFLSHITNNRVVYNEAALDGGGIYINGYYGAARAHIFGNDCYQNYAVGLGSSIYVPANNYTMIHDNRFYTTKGGTNVSIAAGNDAQDNYTL
jgi:hypothetical protein